MSYIIKPLEGRGRGLVAARDIKAGETVVAEEPLLLTVGQDAKDYACAHCLRLLTAGAACRFARWQPPHRRKAPRILLPHDATRVERRDTCVPPTGSLPCQSCHQVAFCSQECAAQAAAKPWVHANATCRCGAMRAQLAPDEQYLLRSDVCCNRYCGSMCSTTELMEPGARDQSLAPQAAVCHGLAP